MFAAILMAGSLALSGRPAAPDPLQPRDYSSPSGAWRVHVDPTRRLGEGPARYHAERGGESVWSAELPFTLFDAVVDDQGFLAGYGYTQGVRELGEFVIALVSPAGELIARHTTQRTPPHDACNGIADPKAAGVVLDAVRGRFLTRVQDPELALRETWLVHDLRTGEALPPIEPLGGSDAWILSVLAIPDRPLYAVLARVSDYRHGPTRHDLELVLVDLEGRTCASEMRRGELEPEVEGEHWDLWQRAEEHGLSMPVAGGFSAWLPRSGLRVDLVAAPRDRGWELEEVGRTAWMPAVEEIELPRAAPAELRHLGDVTLDVAAAESGPLREVNGLGFDELGRLMAVGDLEEGGRCATVVLADPEKAAGSEVLLERRFCLPEGPEAFYQWWPFESGRWLVTCSWRDERFESHGAAWWADPATGALHGLREWSLAGIAGLGGVASTGDGGFIACADWIYGSGLVMSTFASFDAEGRDRWRLEGPTLRLDNGERIGTNGVAVTRAGWIVSLSSGGDSLQIFKLDGTWLESIDLSELTDVSYPWGVEALPAGGFVLIHGKGERPVLRLSDEGEPLGSLVPRTQAGQRLSCRVTPAPDGTLWTTDGRAVMRLGPDGVADRTLLGTLPEAEALYKIASLVVDRRGQRIVVRDERSSTLFVFDANGLLLGRGELAVEDQGPTYAFCMDVAASQDGRVFARSPAHAGSWVAFDGSGQRLGPVDLGRGHVLFAGTDLRWTDTLYRAELLGPEGDVRASIERRADRRWLAGIADLDVAADGSVAILERPEARETRVVTLYAPDGTPRSDHLLPQGADSVWHVVHLGDRVVVRGFEGPAWVLDVERDLWRRCDPSWADEKGIALDASPDEAELWAFETSAGRFRRYALPSD